MKKLLLAFAACAVVFGAKAETMNERVAKLKPGEWLAAQMTGSASDIVTKGSPAAFTSGGKTKNMTYMLTADEKNFKTDDSVGGVQFIQSRDGVALDRWWNYIKTETGAGDCGLGGTIYGKMMDGYWKANVGTGDETFTVTVPAAGTYLVQLVVHHKSTTSVSSKDDESAVISCFAENPGDWYYGGTLVHVFDVDAAGAYSFTLKYTGEVLYNMFQLRDITKHEVLKPSIASVTTIPLKAGVNMTLLGAKPGTDEEGIRVSDYDVYFAAVEQGGVLPEAKKVLSNQIDESCTFLATGLESGKVYDYALTIRNAAGIESKAKKGVIDLRSIADRAKTLPVGSWMACPMTGDASDIVAYGESAQNNGHAMAYAVDSGTLNGVEFTKSYDGVSGYMVAATGYKFKDNTASDGGNCGLDDFYGNTIMGKYFKARYGSGVAHFTVDVPDEGTYVMQMAFHYGSKTGKDKYQISLVENPSVCVRYAAGSSAEDWYYGGTFVYKFNAAEAGQIVFELDYGTEVIYNMFQLRKVPHEDEPAGDVVEPSIGSISAKVRGRSVAVPLGDIIIGTDEKGRAALTYDVYVDRDGTGAELMLAGQKKDSVLVVDKDLLSGEHAYTFTIVNDKGIESKGKEVSFEVAEGVETISDRAARMKPGQWLALPMTGDAADIVSEGVLATNANGNAMAVMVTGDKNSYMTDSSVNDVPFLQALSGVSGKVMVGGDRVFAFGDTGTDAGTCGLGGVLYGDALMGGYYKAGYGSGAPVKFTVEVPAKGTYLMQLACHFQGDSDGKEIVLLDGDGQKTDVKIRPASDVLGGWYYGGTFLHVFKAEEAGTFEFQLWYDHEVEFNMFQLRKVKRNRGMYVIIK